LLTILSSSSVELDESRHDFSDAAAPFAHLVAAAGGRKASKNQLLNNWKEKINRGRHIQKTEN
jgi:hypothetical protein